MKLNLGCGKDNRSGYVNVDMRRNIRPDIICDVKELPFKSKKIEEILALDLLEHFSRFEILSALKEWKRTLKSNGRLIIKTPNINSIARAYLYDQIDEFECSRLLYGNQDYPENFHKIIFDQKSIRIVLKKVGLKIKKIRNLSGGDWKNMWIEAIKK